MRAVSPALERLMNATVRVGTATGVLVANDRNTVVVTANHVVAAAQVEDRDAPVRVWSGAGWSPCAVYARDEQADLAVLVAPPSLAGRGLAILDREFAPGEEVWTCGFPRGWDSYDHPVVCRGIIAGATASEKWANLEASWGNSGGAVVLVSEGCAAIGGLALGKAGDSHAELEKLRSNLAEGRPALGQFLSSMGEAGRQIDALSKYLEDDNIKRIAKGGSPVGEGPGTTQDGLRKMRRLVEQADLLALGAMSDLRTQSVVADFIDQHFRTGFVRFAGATAIREFLDVG